MRILAGSRGDAASYYRIEAPFSVLHYRGVDVDIRTPDAESAKEYDILWLHMHASPMAEIVARSFKDAGKKVVYDIDDWVYALPPSWDSYSHYFERGTGEPTERLVFHQRLLQMADLVTTTIPYLQKEIESRFPGKKVQVLPNCVMMGDWDVLPDARHDRKGPVLGWFGTGNHWDDWVEIVDVVDAVLVEVDGHLALMGAPEIIACFPERLKQRTLLQPLVPMNQFHSVLGPLIKACDVGLVWASDRFEMNKCRSPLKILQWAAAGVPFAAGSKVFAGLYPEIDKQLVDVGGLKDALISKLTSHRREVEKWQQWVFANYSYEMQAVKWLETAEMILR